MKAPGRVSTGSLTSFSGDSAYTGATFSRAADLVIVAQRNPEWASDDAPSIEGVLYDSGALGALVDSLRRFLDAILQSHPRLLER